MDIAMQVIITMFLVSFLIATLFDAVTQMFPGLTAEQADMQDRVERVQDAIQQYNDSEELKK